MLRRLACGLLIAAGCARAQTPTPPAPLPAAARPSLVVLVTVDQLRPDYLDRWRDQLTGGLGRLAREGRFFVNAVHDHANTETAPGHAATLSGRFPVHTGIASNAAGVNTADAPLVGSDGIGASPFRFKGTTLVDWLAAAEPRTRVLSVSRKDRGAILPVGLGKYPVYWYAPATGRFVTSVWYADTLPTWVQAFNAERRVLTRYAGATWTRLLPDAAYPEPDSVPGESGGQGFTFPHVMPADSLRAPNLLQSFPFMDELTLDFAWRGVRTLDLGAGPQTDLLAVSLSTTDAVGHRWGPDSQELHDQVLRLDRMLGTFLDSLVALRGAGKVLVALTSDHGVAPSPEIRSRYDDNAKATRVLFEHFQPALATLGPLVQREGIPADAFTFDDLVLAVDRAKVVGKDRELRDIARRFAREAAKVPGVLRADVLDDLARADTVRDTIGRRWLHMYRPGGNEQVVVTLAPYNYYGRGSIATHGTPHDYDAKVPVIFWGPGVAPGRDPGVARVVDIGPTLAALLGVPPLEPLDGRPLRMAP
jgi:predicted AlkP superfamily pyrophosphatase or phosphodiesterase